MDEKKMHLTYDSENLAVPEIHTNEAEDIPDDSDDSEEIVYEDLAVPEFHVKHAKPVMSVDSRKIYIDADGCPVVKITLAVAAKFNVKCVIICDTSHRIEHPGAETIIVDKGADSADFRLVNLISAGDIAITQDYGLAAMCLSKKAVVLNQDGKQYTGENISGLLEFRAVSKKIRNSGGRLKGSIPKRSQQQNADFEYALKKILNGNHI